MLAFLEFRVLFSDSHSFRSGLGTVLHIKVWNRRSLLGLYTWELFVIIDVLPVDVSWRNEYLNGYNI